MTNYDPQLRDTLHWAARHDDTSKELKRDALHAVRLIDDAEHLHAAIVNDNATTVAELRDAERLALQLLCDKPTRANARAVVDLQQQNDSATQLQLRETRAAERAAAQARATGSQVFHDHVLTLLRLVAIERVRDVTACGDDAVQPIVRNVWRRLQFTWYPQTDDMLLLPHQFHSEPRNPQSYHLPLTWSAQDPQAYRASVAWCWQQIAAGRFERVDKPLTKTDRKRGLLPGAHGKCVRITANVDLLPAVPPPARLRA